MQRILRLAVSAPQSGNADRNANRKLHTDGEHRHDQSQPLLRAKRSRLQIDHWSDEDGEDQKNHTKNEHDSDGPVHRPGV